MIKEFEFGDLIGWGRGVPPSRPATTLDRPLGAGVARSFVGALAARDYDRMERSLHPDVRLRSLLSCDVCERAGAPAVMAQFRDWFGGFADLELVDLVVEEIGRRLHVRWWFRVRTTPKTTRWHLVEQRAYLDVTDRILGLDLLYSGLHGEPPFGRSAPRTRGRADAGGRASVRPARL